MRPGERSPCYGCADRAPGCHGRCEAYMEFDRQNRARREACNRATAAAIGATESFRWRPKRRPRRWEL